LPVNKPRYFMGGGLPDQIVAHVRMGIDLFDCVIPTRHARHGSLFVWNGEPMPERLLERDFCSVINIDNAPYREDDAPVDVHNDCLASQQYTKSYLHHLFANKEILGLQIATEHNVRFYQQLMQLIRQGIDEGIL
ncbi:MAG: tRNA-guanine transglycosylase, partial [Patescibacteria group bacterium]